jgi:D-alanyl-D-alanine carboxypeptidase
VEQEHITQVERVTRRHVLGKALGFGAGALTVAVAGTALTAGAQEVAPANHTSEPYKTTAALNLRTGPSTSHRVILVMPKGATVTLQERYENGFYYVNYKGQLGWAHHDYLVKAGQPTDPVVIGTRVATTRLNLRSGPSTSNQILDVVDKGATVSITDQVRNGYRYVIQHSGPAGWVIDSGLGTGGPPGGDTRTTTARLNLRAEPSTRARVLLVMPAGATVQATHVAANGFLQVSYKGTSGWAFLDYLR